jgi:hypothetical protein
MAGVDGDHLAMRDGRRQHFCRARRRQVRLQRHERAHAVADQQRLGHAGRAEQGQQPGRHRFDAGQCRRRAAPVARQVDCQHVKAVVRKVARLQQRERRLISRNAGFFAGLTLNSVLCLIQKSIALTSLNQGGQHESLRDSAGEGQYPVHRDS